MNDYVEGIRLINESFGNCKDNIVALATVGIEQTANGNPRPIVREVDAMYEDGVFYITTYALSNKIKQIEKNPEVSVLVASSWFTANGIAKNLGWVLDEKNADIRLKLREAFKSWYDNVNNENDKNCCILAIYLTRGTLNVNHWEKLYKIDFENKKILDEIEIY